MHADESDRRLNVLVLFADQFRWDCLGVAGHKVVQTPALDRLAAQGVRFTQALTSTPVCVPARQSMITGVRNGSHRQAGLHPAPGAIPELPTIMTSLGQAGYTTHSVGKTHFKGRHYGFQTMDRMEECPACILDDDYLLYLRANNVTTRFQHGFRDLLYYQPQTLSTPLEHAPNEWVADRSIDFLQDHVRYRGEKPFFLFSSYIHPHPPFAASEPWASMYDPDALEMPQNADRPLAELAYGAIDHRGRLDGAHRDPARMKRIKALYYGLISHVDACIGRTLDELDRLGLNENTVVVFASDHGEMLGEHGLSQKNVPFEPSVRVPLLVRWPGAASGVCDDGVASLLDLYPTLIEGLGLPAPVSHDRLAGQSLLDRLKGPNKTKAAPESFVIDYGYDSDRWLCLRTPSYKYSYWYAEGYEELYDLQEDPGETRNLLRDAPSSALLDLAAKMKAELEKWEATHGFPELLLEHGRFPVIAMPKRPARDEDIRAMLLNQGKWAANLPEDEARLIDSHPRAITRAIAQETTLSRDAVSVEEYERLGGSLVGTPLARLEDE